MLTYARQLFTRGPRPNTSFISASLGTDVLAKNGYVKIKPTLQLPSDARIFAAGDIIDFPEQKQVGKYYTHADIVATNIVSILENQPVTMKYKGPSFEGIVLTIGKVRFQVWRKLDLNTDANGLTETRCNLLQFPLGGDIWRQGLCLHQI